LTIDRTGHTCSSMEFPRLASRVWLAGVLLALLLVPTTATAEIIFEERDGPTIDEARAMLDAYRRAHPEAARIYGSEGQSRYLTVHKAKPTVSFAKDRAGRRVQDMLLNLVSMVDPAPTVTSATRSKPFSRSHAEGLAVDVLWRGTTADAVRAQELSRLGGKRIFVQIEMLIDGVQVDVRFQNGRLYNLVVQDKLATDTHLHIALWKDEPTPEGDPYDILPAGSNVPKRWVIPAWKDPRPTPWIRQRSPEARGAFADFCKRVASASTQPPTHELPTTTSSNAELPAAKPSPVDEDPSAEQNQREDRPRLPDLDRQEFFSRAERSFERPRARPSFRMEWGPLTITPGPARYREAARP
jgi:hypothetical protein